MAAFDAELYLRLAGERQLLDQHGENRGYPGSGLGVAAGALCAIGAISEATAQEVIDDYTLALALRNEGHAHHLAMRRAHRQASQQQAPPLQPRRVVPCYRRIDHGSGELEVRYVSLGADSTRVAITLRPTRSQRRRTHRRGTYSFGAGSFGPPSVRLTDDHGTSTSSHFSGGGSDDEWEGHLVADRPLAQKTAWIELDGERIDLVEEPLRHEVRVEELPPEDPGLRYLWRQLAATDRFHHHVGAIETAIEALVAAGSVDAAGADLDNVRAVADALQQGQRPRGRGRELPEPWRSLFAHRRRANGPTGTIAIGAVTPPIDGISIAVTSIESQPDGFTAEVEIAPGLNVSTPFDPEIARGDLAWWAADDRGNHYLGEIGSWSGSDTHSQGTIEFSPPLDPNARELRVMPTAETSRAVITVPLTWSQPPRSAPEDDA